MTTEIQEIESKFEATPGFELPVLDGLPQVADVSRGEVETLTAEYYDTEDLRLIRAGITLRRREGGADEGWHLKLPDGKPSSRRELRAPLGNTVPDELARLVRGHARGAALRPVARVETRRRTTTLRDSAGNSLAEIAEDDVTAQSLGSATTVSRWNEVEAELTGAGLRPGMTATKVQRALATSLPRPTGSPDKLNTGSPSGEVVMAYLGEQAAKLKALDTAVRRDEPDAIHQMRVTARRLRSTLQAFPMIWLPSTTDHVKDELKWLGQVLGEARDTEVLSEYFRAALAGVPAELML